MTIMAHWGHPFSALLTETEKIQSVVLSVQNLISRETHNYTCKDSLLW